MSWFFWKDKSAKLYLASEGKGQDSMKKKMLLLISQKKKQRNMSDYYDWSYTKKLDNLEEKNSLAHKMYQDKIMTKWEI
jgi:Na+-transporting NADH:ubiquinone oxidoreductase subunit NqrF